MADLRRLGRPGSYRLGRLGAPPPASSVPPVHHPSFAPRYRGLAVVSLVACPAGVVIVAAGALAGWWFLPFVVGVAFGALARFGRWRLRITLPAVVIMGAGGSALALWWHALTGLPEGAAARLIAARVGLPPHAVAVTVAVLLTAAILSAAGLWLGGALARRHASK